MPDQNHGGIVIQMNNANEGTKIDAVTPTYEIFVHKILCMQNCFTCMSVHLGNCAGKRVEVALN